VAHRNAFATVPVPGIGDLRLFNLTAKFSRTPGCVSSPPPVLGEHTREVLAGIGYTDSEITRLRESGVV